MNESPRRGQRGSDLRRMVSNSREEGDPGSGEEGAVSVTVTGKEEAIGEVVELSHGC